MEKPYPKEAYGLFGVWLAVFFGAVAAWSCIQPQTVLFGRVQGLCLICLALLDALMLLILVTGRIYWLDGVTYEQAVRMEEAERRSYALWHLLCFLAATAGYLAYCLLVKYQVIRGADIRSALTGGAVICAAAVVSSGCTRKTDVH